jgi:hypothetical protein
VTHDLFAFGEAATDLNHLSDDALAEAANYCGVFGERRVSLTTSYLLFIY